MMVSVYLFVDDPFGVEGSPALSRPGEALHALGRAFIIAGDWNAAPLELAQRGWAGKLSGRIVAPSDITCRSGKGRMLDYFAASDAPVPSVQSCAVACNSFLYPRRPVTTNGVVPADVLVSKGPVSSLGWGGGGLG